MPSALLLVEATPSFANTLPRRNCAKSNEFAQTQIWPTREPRTKVWSPGAATSVVGGASYANTAKRSARARTNFHQTPRAQILRQHVRFGPIVKNAALARANPAQTSRATGFVAEHTLWPTVDFLRDEFYDRPHVSGRVVKNTELVHTQTPLKPPDGRIRWQGAGFEPIVTKHCARAYTNPVQTSAEKDSMGRF